MGFPSTGCWRCSSSSTSTAVPGRSPSKTLLENPAPGPSCGGPDDVAAAAVCAGGLVPPEHSTRVDAAAQCILPRTSSAPPEQTAYLAPLDPYYNIPNQRNVVHHMEFGRLAAPICPPLPLPQTLRPFSLSWSVDYAQPEKSLARPALTPLPLSRTVSPPAPYYISPQSTCQQWAHPLRSKNAFKKTCADRTPYTLSCNSLAVSPPPPRPYAHRPYRGTSLVRNSPPPRTPLGP